jgi:hypothetical protein
MVRILVADSNLRVRSALHVLLLQEPEPIAVAEPALAIGVDDSVYAGDPPETLLAACRRILAKPAS